MKKILALSLAALSAGCMAEEPLEMTASAQTELTRELEGRVAGPPQACVPQRQLGGNRSIGEGVLIFRGMTNSVVYVNRPPAGCPILDSGRTLVTRTSSSQLCAGDIAQVVDPVSGAFYGACGLGDFTPYRRLR